MVIERFGRWLLGTGRPLEVLTAKSADIAEENEEVIEIHREAIKRAIAAGVDEDSILALKYLIWQIEHGALLTYSDAREEVWQRAQRLKDLEDLSPMLVCDIVYMGNVDAMLGDIEAAYEILPQIDETLGLQVAR